MWSYEVIIKLPHNTYAKRPKAYAVIARHLITAKAFSINKDSPRRCGGRWGWPVFGCMRMLAHWRRCIDRLSHNKYTKHLSDYEISARRLIMITALSVINGLPRRRGSRWGWPVLGCMCMLAHWGCDVNRLPHNKAAWVRARSEQPRLGLARVSKNRSLE